MEQSNRLIDHYLPPPGGFILESIVATTYQVDFEFLEEELLAVAVGVQSHASRIKAFRSEFERKLQKIQVSVLYDQRGCGNDVARFSPRIDTIPISARKLHSKISLLMWVREDRATGTSPERRMRLIVGSANLTRQGFRENYECVTCLDFGGSNSSPRSMLASAIELVRDIASDSTSPQLARQLDAFAAQVSLLPRDAPEPDDPVALVDASGVVPAMRDAWNATSSESPRTITVVSPFWAEGSTAVASLTDLIAGFGKPACVELICRGERSPDGKSWLPIFDSSIALRLKNALDLDLYLRPALPDIGDQDVDQGPDDAGDETEEKALVSQLGNESLDRYEVQRSLHAKLILLDGPSGSVLYAGSSNCTMRGLGLGGPTNFEAGFVFRLTSRLRKRLGNLLAFAGKRMEVLGDQVPHTIQPISEADPPSPTFLAEVIAAGSSVIIRFRDSVPLDLVLLMPRPSLQGDAGYWVLYQANAEINVDHATLNLDLNKLAKCDEELVPIKDVGSERKVEANVSIEARWEGHRAKFPVRFDDKTRLPLILAGRKPTEAELIDYYLFGTSPDEWGDEVSIHNDSWERVEADSAIDTRRILAYFIRRFVQAIPGVETELIRAAYSPSALDSALRGPTSPMEMAERAYASLGQSPTRDEPQKTPIAVGFQLTEILALLIRCKAKIGDASLACCFDPVVAHLQHLLASLISQHIELQGDGFHSYQSHIIGDRE